MASVNLENVFIKNYGTNIVWIIDNFRFQNNHSKTLPQDRNEKSKWEIQFSLSGEGNSRITGSLHLNRGITSTAHSYDPYYGSSSYSYNWSASSATSNMILKTLLVQLDENGEVGQIFNHQDTVNTINSISFSGEIARGKSYPYDSLRLCFCLTEANQNSGPHIGLTISSTVKVNSSKAYFLVNQGNPSQKSNMFATYSDLLCCGTVSLLRGQNGYFCDIIPKTNVLYCIVSFFVLSGKRVCQTEKWFTNANPGVKISTSVIPYENFKDVTGNLTAIIEVAVPVAATTQDVYRFLEKPRNSTKISEYSSQENAYGGKKKINYTYNTFSEPSLMEEIWSIYDEQKLSDLTIHVGDQSFYVHKTVLCARSPVFETMLQCDMQEKKSSVIKIKDATPKIVKKFLNFIYSDKLPAEFNHEEFIHLYSIADKYQVKLLKKKCSDILKSCIDVGNVCDVLELADMHQDESLKDSCFVFMKSNAGTFFDSEEWKGFMMRKVHLAAKAMHFCLKKK